MSEVIIIDPVKVVELQGATLTQLARLVNACMKGWKSAPSAVKIELGNACTLMNQLVTNEQHKTEPGSDKGGGDRNDAPSPSGVSGAADGGVEQANPAILPAPRSQGVRKIRRLTI